MRQRLVLRMAFYEPKSYNRMSLGHSNNMLTKLVIVCLTVFIGLSFMRTLSYFSHPKEVAVAVYQKNVLSQFILPASWDQLLHKPWTVLSFMFAQDNFWQIFTDMIWLWCFGYILQDLKGNKKIIPLFFYGGLGGAAAFLLAYHFIPSLQSQIPIATLGGASASVMAVVVATTILSPGYRLFPLLNGGIPLWVLTIVYIAADFLTVSISDSATLIIHFAGAVVGAVYILLYKKGIDCGKWMNRFFDWVTNLFNPDKPKKGSNIKKDLFYKATKEPFTITPNVTQERIDNILDKINQQGYHQLTEEEKDVLKRAEKEGL